MEYIHKLPFIVGSFMAIVVGMVNYKLGVDQQDIFSRMAISLVLFFAAGLVFRNLLANLLEELEKRKKEQEELEEQQKAAHSKHSDTEQEIADISQHTIDYRLDSEEFTPLKVSEVLSSTLEEK